MVYHNTNDTIEAWEGSDICPRSRSPRPRWGSNLSAFLKLTGICFRPDGLKVDGLQELDGSLGTSSPSLCQQVWGSQVLLHRVPSYARGAEAQGGTRTCPKLQKHLRDRCRTECLVRLLLHNGAGLWQPGRRGELGKPAPYWELGSFGTFPCFLTVSPDLPLPPEDFTAAASIRQPAGPAGVPLHSKYGQT